MLQNGCSLNTDNEEKNVSHGSVRSENFMRSFNAVVLILSKIIAARTLTSSGKVMNAIGVPHDDLTPANSSDPFRRCIYRKRAVRMTAGQTEMITYDSHHTREDSLTPECVLCWDWRRSSTQWPASRYVRRERRPRFHRRREVA